MLSGNYRNTCPGFTKTRVRELLKSLSGNLRNPHRFREPYFSGGVEEHQLGEATIRMYTISKTLADAFRNQRLVDRSVAIEALKTAIEQRKATASAIAEAAREYGAWNQMRPYLEAVTSNG
ncbi:hypothetical protein [Paracoccus sp. (in: a-proteobacteria)]|uniref:hypothetical protein n=1 Tax=Paracoccus sp. TaxID=267 RepID=UPI003A8C4CAB